MTIHASVFKQALIPLALSCLLVLPGGASAQVVTTVDCDLMGLVVNVGSQPGTLSLYHPGGYLTSPSSANVMAWEFTDSEGGVLHEETLVGNSFVSFSFDLPLTDTLFVSVLLTNDSALHNGYPVACLIEDFLTWEETEVIPGTFVGGWTLGGSNGVDVSGPSGCMDPDLIDPEVACPAVVDPVCGCDGVTYSNACEATSIGGVLYWDPGPCVVIEYGGCTYPLACNYDAGAGFEDGSCLFPPEHCFWPDSWSVGCTYHEAINYNENATVDDGSCFWEPCGLCPGDANGDGSISVSDILYILGVFGTDC